MIRRGQFRARRGMLAMIAMALASGCVAPAVQPAAQADAPLQTVLRRPVASGTLSLTPLAIVEDSRCPANVQCIQAGTVRLNLKLSEKGRDRLTEIGLAEPVRLAGGSWLHLAAVCPARLDPDPVEPGSYRFTFLISAAQQTGAAEPHCS